jgi:hypothetical protein
MPKYYVDAGDLRKIVDRNTPEEAAIEVFKSLDSNPVPCLNRVTIVSEEGFDSTSDEDWAFLTIDLLEQSNQIANYKPEF